MQNLTFGESNSMTVPIPPLSLIGTPQDDRARLLGEIVSVIAENEAKRFVRYSPLCSRVHP